MILYKQKFSLSGTSQVYIQKIGFMIMFCLNKLKSKLS